MRLCLVSAQAYKHRLGCRRLWQAPLQYPRVPKRKDNGLFSASPMAPYVLAAFHLPLETRAGRAGRMLRHPTQSSLGRPKAIACQNRPRSSRCHPDGRPGERTFSRVHLSDARFWTAIATSNQLVLRQPLESAQYVSIRYSARLAEAGIEPSAGSVGDSSDNAFAETINGLYKAEVIHRHGPWRAS